MTIKIHHNTMKRAARLGITLVANGTGVTASKDGTSIKAATAAEAMAQLLGETGATVENIVARLKAAPKSAAKKAKKTHKPRRASDDEDGEDDEEEEGDERGKSVVKRVYKMRYKPHKHKCGDDISKQVSAHVSYKDEDKKIRTDQDKLVRFAKANDCWDPKYRNLNGGMRRMNIVNRLRAKMRKGHKVVWPA